MRFPEVASMLPLMGNDLADAIRTQLRLALLGKYGTLEAAADALGMSYKTLYRHLTDAGKDRTARVSLDFVLDVTNHLAQTAGIDFAEIYRRAQIRPDVPTTEDDLTLRAPRATYGLAADEGDMKRDQPAAD